MHKVFVYGTLKKGFPNYEINMGSCLNETFVTKNQFSLYLVSERHCPWLVVDEEKGCNVKGQVFSVDESTLKDMDKLERITEPDGYQRIKITVQSLNSSQELNVFAYVKPVEQLDGAQIQSKLGDEYMFEHASFYKRLNL